MIYKLGGDVAVKARRDAFAAKRPKTAPGAGVMAPKPAAAATGQPFTYTLPSKPQFAGPSAALAQQPAAKVPTVAEQQSPAASIANTQQRFRQGAQALQGKMQEARQQFQKGLGGVSSWFSGQRQRATAPVKLPTKNGPTPLPPVQSGKVQAPGRPAVATAATFTKPDGTVVMPPRGQPRTAATLGASGTPRGMPSAKEMAARARDVAAPREGGLESPAIAAAPPRFDNNNPHSAFKPPRPQPVKPTAGF